jgi:outer membrane protein W
MWTFGAAVGLQYAFTDPPRRWRPFVGLALGNRIALSETTATLTPQTRTGVTPTAILGLEAGVRYVLSTRMQLLGELEVTRGWLGPTASENSPEDERASAMALHASVGVLFEY